MTIEKLIPIAFALTVVIICLVWSSRYRLSGGNLMQTRSGKSYFWYHRPRARKQSPKSYLTVPSNGMIGFTLEKEGYLQRIAKWFGLASEFQTQDLNFDDKIYILTDIEDFCLRLQRDSGLRQAFMRIFSHGVDSIISNVRRGEIRLNFYPAIAMLDADTAEEIVSSLETINKHIQNMGYNGVQRDTFLRRASHAWIWLCGGMLFGGITALATMPYHLRDPQELFYQALLVSLVGSLGALALIKIIFGGSAYGYRALQYFLCFGVLGLAFVGYDAYYAMNYYYDKSAPTVRRQTITEKYTTRHKNSTSYHIKIHSWRDNEDPISLNVGYNNYSRANIGGRVHLLTHPGYLGYEWIERYDIQ